MIYVGNNEMGAFTLLKISRKMDQIKYEDFPVEQGARLSEYVDELISISDKLYVIDITSFSDTEEIVVSSVDRICRAVNCDIIIYAPEMDPQSTILVSFRAIGYTKIITHFMNQTLLMQEMQKAIDQEKVYPDNVQEELISQRDDVYDALYAANPVMAAIDQRENNQSAVLDSFLVPSMAGAVQNKADKNTEFEYTGAAEHIGDVKELEPLKNKDIEVDNNCINVKRSDRKRMLKIAVIGSMSRIGTTTVALQLVKFFNDQEEHSAAYLQDNSSNFMDTLREHYYVDLSSAAGSGKLEKVSYSNIDMFDDPKKINAIISSGYRYVVYDYGNIKTINQASAFEKDIILLVGGTEPDELSAMTKAMEIFGQKNVFYFFNFTPFADMGEIREMMEDKKERTYFLDYIPNKFMYSPELGQSFAMMMASDFEADDLTTGKEKRLGRIFRR